MQAEIIAIGSELLTPFKQDTNSLFLTDKLNQLGMEVAFKTIVGDSRPNLVSVARTALLRSDILFFMGGLGPTEDDLTREAVAEAVGVELKRSANLVAELAARFAARRIKMARNNERQADLLAGAIILKNSLGSAPGQWLQITYASREKIIVLLPGPPRELQPMYETQCADRLRAVLPPFFLAKQVLKVALVPESECDARIAPIYKKHTAVQTTILAAPGEVQVHLTSRAPSIEEAQELIGKVAEEIEEELGDRVFSTAGESLEQIVGYYLQMRGMTLAAAESCTGGLFSQRITSVSGSSRYFLGGAVAYSDPLKRAFADVPGALIKANGAVSSQVAGALAEGIRKRCEAGIGVGITGIAGPGGGTAEKPIGLVYMAVADGVKTEIIERRFPGDREAIRWWAAQQTLDMVRRKLI